MGRGYHTFGKTCVADWPRLKLESVWGTRYRIRRRIREFARAQKSLKG